MYHYADGDISRGPIAREGLRGRINAQTLVWREGMADWVPAGTLAELADLFAPPSPPPTDPAFAAEPIPLGEPMAPASAAPNAWPQPAPGPIGAMSYEHQQVVGPPPGLAIASMVLGIVGIVTTCVQGFGVICAILALIFGYMARGQGARGLAPGAAMATAGIVMGWIPIGFMVVAIVLFIGVMIVGAMAQ